MQKVTEFLETFFCLLCENALPPIGKDYLFSELVHPVFRTVDYRIKVWVTVKYIDEATIATQFSQYYSH